MSPVQCTNNDSAVLKIFRVRETLALTLIRAAGGVYDFQNFEEV